MVVFFNFCFSYIPFKILLHVIRAPIIWCGYSKLTKGLLVFSIPLIFFPFLFHFWIKTHKNSKVYECFNVIFELQVWWKPKIIFIQKLLVGVSIDIFGRWILVKYPYSDIRNDIRRWRPISNPAKINSSIFRLLRKVFLFF